MSDVNDVLSSAFSDDDDVIFDPSEDELIPEGSYPAHIIDISSTLVTTRWGNRADIYKPTYKISNTVELYGGIELHDDGIWRFRKMKNETTNPRQSNSNRQFRNAMKTLEVEVIPVDVNGKKMFKLPELNRGNTYGKPVMINVYHKTFKGKYGIRTIAEARLASKWEEGGQLDDFDIPF